VKIIHIDNADNGGGASRSAYRLHDGLRRLGENSGMYVLNKRTKDLFVKRFQSSSGKIKWISRNMRRLRLNLSMFRYERSAPEDQTFFSEDRTPFYKDSCRQIPESDVINLHWFGGIFLVVAKKHAAGLDPSRHGSFYGWLLSRYGMRKVYRAMWSLPATGVL